MVGIISNYTFNYKFALVRFDAPGWQSVEHANWSLVDTLLNVISALPGIRGAWTFNTLYNVGERVSDIVTGAVFRCVISHSSPMAGTTFADYRAANPTQWKEIITTPLFTGNWATTINYNPGDIVVIGQYAYYYCLEGHTATAFGADLILNRWTLVWDARAAVAAVDGIITGTSARLGLRIRDNSFGSTAITNLNDAIQPGFYQTITGAGGALNTPDGPAGTNFWQVRVESNTIDWVIQIATNMAGTPTTGHDMWRRSSQNGVWGAWHRLRSAAWEIPTKPTNVLWSLISAGDNVSGVVPAGGTHAYTISAYNASTLVLAATNAGVVAGGTVVGAGQSGIIWRGFSWRID